MPDELMQAYRRASANDGSRPSEWVRESILARSRRVVTSRNNAAERSLPLATPAANGFSWKWKAAASLAAVGLAGLLALQTFVTVPHGATPTRADATTEKPPRVAELAPATTTSKSAAISAAPPAAVANPEVSEQIRPNLGNEANPPRSVATTPPEDAAAPQEKVSGPARSGADASRTEALTARPQSPMNNLAARAAALVLSPRRDQAAAALHAMFPALFTGPATTGSVRVAMVLNSDGTVYKIAREDSAAAGHADAALQLSQALDIGPEELETPAEIIVFDRTAEQPNTILVAFGIRRNNPDPARDGR
jgi:hypothetical protein